MFPPKGTRSEEVATGEALGGRGSPKLGVIDIGGILEDRSGTWKLVEVSLSVDPQGRGGVDKVKCGLTS